jgi:hypothetical protein
MHSAFETVAPRLCAAAKVTADVAGPNSGTCVLVVPEKLSGARIRTGGARRGGTGTPVKTSGCPRSVRILVAAAGRAGLRHRAAKPAEPIALPHHPRERSTKVSCLPTRAAPTVLRPARAGIGAVLPPNIFVHFAGCQPRRAETMNGRVWHREPDEGDEDFENRVKGDLPERGAVPSVVIFFGDLDGRNMNG